MVTFLWFFGRQGKIREGVETTSIWRGAIRRKYYNLWQNYLEQNLKIVTLCCRNIVNFHELKCPLWGLQGWSLPQRMIPPPSLSQCWWHQCPRNEIWCFNTVPGKRGSVITKAPFCQRLLLRCTYQHFRQLQLTPVLNTHWNTTSCLLQINEAL